MNDIKMVHPRNIGWLEVDLDDTEMKFLWDALKNPQRKIKRELAGNIKDSRSLIDKDNWFFDNVLLNLCQVYAVQFKNLGEKIPVQKRHPYHLTAFWANYQMATEFNPLHNHTGVYSFVVWMKIPTHYSEQIKNSIALNSTIDDAISNFAFNYIDILGEQSYHTYKMSPKQEGKLVFFPAKLMHQVFPFYNCDDERISISGNISIDTSKECT